MSVSFRTPRPSSASSSGSPRFSVGEHCGAPDKESGKYGAVEVIEVKKLGDDAGYEYVVKTLKGQVSQTHSEKKLKKIKSKRKPLPTPGGQAKSSFEVGELVGAPYQGNYQGGKILEIIPNDVQVMYKIQFLKSKKEIICTEESLKKVANQEVGKEVGKSPRNGPEIDLLAQLKKERAKEQKEEEEKQAALDEMEHQKQEKIKEQIENNPRLALGMGVWNGELDRKLRRLKKEEKKAAGDRMAAAQSLLASFQGDVEDKSDTNGQEQQQQGVYRNSQQKVDSGAVSKKEVSSGGATSHQNNSSNFIGYNIPAPVWIISAFDETIQTRSWSRIKDDVISMLASRYISTWVDGLQNEIEGQSEEDSGTHKSEQIKQCLFQLVGRDFVTRHFPNEKMDSSLLRPPHMLPQMYTSLSNRYRGELCLYLEKEVSLLASSHTELFEDYNKATSNLIEHSFLRYKKHIGYDSDSGADDDDEESEALLAKFEDSSSSDDEEENAGEREIDTSTRFEIKGGQGYMIGQGLARLCQENPQLTPRILKLAGNKLPEPLADFVWALILNDPDAQMRVTTAEAAKSIDAKNMPIANLLNMLISNTVLFMELNSKQSDYTRIVRSTLNLYYIATEQYSLTATIICCFLILNFPSAKNFAQDQLDREAQERRKKLDDLDELDKETKKQEFNVGEETKKARELEKRFRQKLSPLQYAGMLIRLSDLFIPSPQEAMAIVEQVFNHLSEKHEPLFLQMLSVYATANESEVLVGAKGLTVPKQAESLFTRWLEHLFVGFLSNECTCFIWDQLLLFGPSFRDELFYTITLEIILMMGPTLMNARDIVTLDKVTVFQPSFVMIVDLKHKLKTLLDEQKVKPPPSHLVPSS